MEQSEPTTPILSPSDSPRDSTIAQLKKYDERLEGSKELNQNLDPEEEYTKLPATAGPSTTHTQSISKLATETDASSIFSNNSIEQSQVPFTPPLPAQLRQRNDYEQPSNPPIRNQQNSRDKKDTKNQTNVADEKEEKKKQCTALNKIVTRICAQIQHWPDKAHNLFNRFYRLALAGINYLLRHRGKAAAVVRHLARLLRLRDVAAAGGFVYNTGIDNLPIFLLALAIIASWLSLHLVTKSATLTTFAISVAYYAFRNSSGPTPDFSQLAAMEEGEARLPGPNNNDIGQNAQGGDAAGDNNAPTMPEAG